MIEKQAMKKLFAYRNMTPIKNLSEMLFQESGIRFLNSTKLFVNRGCFSHLESNEDWLINYHNKYLSNPDAFNKRLKVGINYWRSNKNFVINEIAEDARNNFDMDARIEFVFEDVVNKCFHLYSFYSNKKNADKAYSFYDLHRSKLLKFIAFFDREATPLIAESCKKENMIKIPNYSDFTVQKSKRSYGEELKLENASFEITDREFEVMILYASGCTIKKIAKIMDKSPHSIASYLPNVWEKTNCKNRIDLRQYVVKNGWGNIERFFFNYV